MVQVIPQTGLGDLLGSSLGQGISKGAELGLQQMLKRLSEQQENEQIMSMIAKAKTMGQTTTEQPIQGQTDASPLAGMVGGQIGAQQSNAIPQGTNPDLLTALTLTKGQKGANVAKALAEQDKLALKKFQSQQQGSQFLIKQNQPKYEESSKRVEALGDDALRLEKLKGLEESGKIDPQWKTAIFFKDGKLRMPFLFSPETQEFTKVITDFVRGAKDSFGARVTNFELDVFLQKLPSLMNSVEGRKAIRQNLETINSLNMLNEKGIIDAFDEAGLGNINISQAKKIAERNNKEEIQRLKKEYINPQGTRKIIQQSTKDRQETQSRGALSKDLAQQFLNEAKGNKAEARKLAKEAGYNF